MNDENPFSSPTERSAAEPARSLNFNLRQLIFDLLGYGTLVAFSYFLQFAARRYHSVYGWAHQAGRNISPEQFYQSANNATYTILLVVVAAIIIAIRSKNLSSKIIGGICVVACLWIFFQSIGYVSARF